MKNINNQIIDLKGTSPRFCIKYTNINGMAKYAAQIATSDII
jgi:hypothetical protein